MSQRLLWRRLHLWIGVAVGLFLVGITLSGIVLMFDDKVNSWLKPDLYAVSGPTMGQAPDVYFAKAKEAVPNGDAYQLRYPEEAGYPALVMMRLAEARAAKGGDSVTSAAGQGGEGRKHRHEGEQTGADQANVNAADGANGADAANGEHARRKHGEGEHRDGDSNNAASGSENTTPPAAMNGGGNGAARGRAQIVAVYLDPPTAKVLGSADPRASFVGWALNLHANLLMPAFNGRQIVGWIGCGLFILCLTGLYLWWPRNAGFLRGLRWKRGPTVSINLHHRAGLWIVLPLGFMAFTGFIQGFPQQSKAITGAILPTTPQPPRRNNNATVTPSLAPQRVLDLASSEAQGFHPTLLATPQDAGQPWRVVFENEAGDRKTVLVDDAKETVSQPPQPLEGDSLLALLRRLHEGHHDGPVWEAIVFVTALGPPLFFVTGIMMWLRRRKNAKALALRTNVRPAAQTIAAAAE